jgi:hypothetical protein
LRRKLPESLMTDAKDIAGCPLHATIIYPTQSVAAWNDKKVTHFPTPSPATAVSGQWLNGDQAHLHFERSSVAGFAAQIQQVFKHWRVVITFARHRKFFHDGASFNNMKSYECNWLLVKHALPKRNTPAIAARYSA